MPRLPLRLAAALAPLLLAAAPLGAQDTLPGGLAVRVAPRAWLVTEQGRNLVLVVGPRGTLLVGQQEPALVARARAALAALHASPVRYALVSDAPGAEAWEDGGWEAQGALAIAHEALRLRMRRALRAGAAPAGAGVRVPSLGFSEVVQVELDEEEEAHFVKQPAGLGPGDAAVHLEGAGILYLGSYTSDSYPPLDPTTGSLSGLIATDSAFVENFAPVPQMVEPIVPGRGPLATLAQLRQYTDMLRSVRSALLSAMQQGRTVDQAIAAHPTAAFDSRFARGGVSAESFIRAVWEGLVRERTAAP